MNSQARLKHLIAIVGLTCGLSAHAQSTVGELLKKGGQQLTKADLMEMMPLRVQTKWPNLQGEDDLLFSLDGKITGKGLHYASQTESPAEGAWKLEDDGKLCAPKKFTKWGSKTDLCWYLFRLETDYFGGLTNVPDAKISGKINSFAKVSGEIK